MGGGEGGGGGKSITCIAVPAQECEKYKERSVEWWDLWDLDALALAVQLPAMVEALQLAIDAASPPSSPAHDKEKRE